MLENQSITYDLSVGDLDDFVDVCADLVERGNNAFACDYLDLAKHYLEGTPNIVVEFVDRSGENYVAILHSVPLSGDIDPHGRRFEVADRGGLDAHLHISMSDCYRYDQLVLIQNVESVNCPQYFVPTLVRFERSNETLGGFTDAMYRGSNGFYRFFSGPAYWKGVVTADCIPFSPDKIANQDVERGSKIVDTISDHAGPMVRQGFEPVDLPEMLSGLIIVLSNHMEGVGFNKRLKLHGKVLDVLFGPVSL